MRVLLRDLNDPTKFRIEDVEGHTPPNLVTSEIPQDVDANDADCLDLETYQDEMGLERVRAVVNEARKAAKEALKLEAEEKRKQEAQAKAARQEKAKEAKSRVPQDWTKLKNDELLLAMKDLEARLAALEDIKG